MGKIIRIKTVSLVKAPGYRSGEFKSPLSFSEGVNIVCGPNGSGKTTLSNGIRSTVFPFKKEGFEVYCTASDGTCDYDLSFSNGRQEQRCHQTGESRLPGVPAPDGAFSYGIQFVDLMQNAADDLAQMIRKEISYGIDMDKAKRESAETMPFPRAKLEAIENLKKRLSDSSENQHLAVELSRRIEAHEAAIAGLPSLQGRLVDCEQAIILKENTEKLADLQLRLEGFDVAIEKVSEDTLRRLDDLKQAYDKAASERQELVSRINALQQEKESIGIGSSVDPVRLRNRIERLSAVESDLGRARVGLDECRAACDSFQEQFGWLGFDSDEAPQGRASAAALLDALGRASAESEKVRGDLVIARRRLEMFDSERSPFGARLHGAFSDGVSSDGMSSDGEPADGEASDGKTSDGKIPAGKAPDGEENGLDARLHLRAELEEAKRRIQKAIGAPRKMRSLALPICIAALSLTLAIVLRSWIPSAAGVVALFGLMLAIRESKVRIDIPECVLDEFFITKSNNQTMEACLAALERIQASIDWLSELIARRRELEAAEAGFERWRARYSEAAAALGISIDDPGFEGRPFFNYSNEISKYLDALGKLGKAAIEVSNLEAARQSSLAQLSVMIGDRLDDSSLAIDKAHMAEEGLRRWNELEKAIAGDKRQLERSEEALKDASIKLDSFWAALGLEAGDEKALSSLAAGREEHQRIKDEISVLRSQMSVSAEAARLAESDRRALEELRAGLAEDIRNAEQRREELGRDRNEYGKLIDSDEIAQCRMELDRRLDDLRRDWEEYSIQFITPRIADEAAKTAISDKTPRLLELARAWMKRFTEGQHDVQFADDSFASYDSSKGMLFSTAALSSGTKAQLLLALRLAAIEVQEKEAAYPLFLDEVLANSDDQRSEAVAGALASIAKGRQVFFFSAQDNENGMILQKCREMGVPSAVINLDAREKTAGEALAFVPREHKSYRFDCPYDEWMKVNDVGSGKLHTPVQELSVWYLLSDVSILADCMDKGLFKVYQAVAAPSLSDLGLAEVRNAIEQARKLAISGRPPLVDQDSLNDLDLAARRKNLGYWQDTVRFVRENGPVSAKELLAAIDEKKVKGYSAQGLEAFASALTDGGFIDERTAVDIEVIIDSIRSQGFSPAAVNAAERYLRMLA